MPRAPKHCPLMGCLCHKPKRQATAERLLAETSVEAAAMMTAEAREMVAAMAAANAAAMASTMAVAAAIATASDSCVERIFAVDAVAGL